MRPVPSLASSLVVAALAVSGAVSVSVSVAALAGPEAKPKAPALSPALAAKGRAVYQTSCTVCHGDGGAGDGVTGKYLNPPPRNFAKEAFKQGDSVEAIFATLLTGVPGTPMVAFPQLTEEDRWAVAWYVAHFRPTSKDGKKAKKIIDALPPLTTAAAPAAPAPTPAAASSAPTPAPVPATAATPTP